MDKDLSEDQIINKVDGEAAKLHLLNPVQGRSQDEMPNSNSISADQSAQSFQMRPGRTKIFMPHMTSLDSNSGDEQNQLQMPQVKEVFTDERKLDQRKQGFERARTNAKATVLSEFM